MYLLEEEVERTMPSDLFLHLTCYILRLLDSVYVMILYFIKLC
jgi:hypothetical protein